MLTCLGHEILAHMHARDFSECHELTSNTYLDLNHNPLLVFYSVFHPMKHKTISNKLAHVFKFLADTVPLSLLSKIMYVSMHAGATRETTLLLLITTW